MNIRYENMLSLPHHQSQNHPRMSMELRAAQFSPFAALTGHTEAIKEAGRNVECRRELCPDEKDKLDRIMQKIIFNSQKHPAISIIYFVADTNKEGGIYKTKMGILNKIDYYKGILVFQDKSEVQINDIYSIECMKDSSQSVDKSFYNEL